MLKSLKEKQVLACSSSKARKASQKADLGPFKEPNLLRPSIKMLFLEARKKKPGNCISLTRHTNATRIQIFYTWNKEVKPKMDLNMVVSINADMSKKKNLLINA